MKKLAVILGSFIIFVTGCSNMPGIYKIDIPQGNYISKSEINRIRPGMTRKQVRYILGSPMIIDSFRNNRWDYVYTFRKGGKKKITTKRVSIFFTGGRVSKIEGDFKPEFTDQTVAAEKAQVVKIKTHKKKKKGLVRRMMPFTRSELARERRLERKQEKARRKAEAAEAKRLAKKRKGKTQSSDDEEDENSQNFNQE